MNLINAPFTEDQVKSLNAYQNSDKFHPFTCGGKGCRQNIVAKEEGWSCHAPGCKYTQDWAHDWMANWKWRDNGIGT